IIGSCMLNRGAAPPTPGWPAAHPPQNSTRPCPERLAVRRTEYPTPRRAREVPGPSAEAHRTGPPDCLWRSVLPNGTEADRKGPADRPGVTGRWTPLLRVPVLDRQGRHAGRRQDGPAEAVCIDSLG